MKPKTNEKDIQTLTSLTKPIIYFSLAIIMIGIILFGVWGGLAPLDSAAVAEGHITVSGNHKVIQHLEGGVISKILVKEGDTVQKDQPLIVLENTSAKAKVKQLNWQLLKERAVEQRLLAEEKELDKINFPNNSSLLKQKNAQKIKDIQEQLFKGRKEKFTAKLNILHQRASQCHDQIKGLKSQLTSVDEQLKSFHEELSAFQKLHDKGYVAKEKIWNVKRNINELDGKQSDVQSRIYVTIKELGAVELEMLQLQHEFKKEIFSEFQEVHNHILELREHLKIAKEILKRLTIRAPQTGIVTDLQYHTEGGVISPGHKIMDIVPHGDKLIVEAKVQPKDIESIKIDLLAKIQLNAYKSRLVPRLEGNVIHVSPDRLFDDLTRMYYYLAKIEIPEKELKKLKAGIKLYPGMPVTVFIVKGTRTVLQYLLAPLTESFQKSFKEQ